MLALLSKIHNEFRSLPMAFQILAGVLGGGGILCLVVVLTAGTDVSFLPVFIVLLSAGVLFYAVGMIARLIIKKRGRQMDDSLWGETMGKGMDGEYDTREEADTAKEQQARLKDVHQLLGDKGYNLYTLPWYFVIGPSQSGKTTLIQKSSQEFPIGDKPVVQFGGTKNCNWFFTNKAILIDTAGRFIDQYGQSGSIGPSAGVEAAMGGDEYWQENKDDWENLLGLLLKHRSRSPINGIVFCLRVPDILDPDPARVQQTAEMLRNALRDIEEKLKIQCPVYIMITMCDRLDGFFEFFSMLPGLADRSLCGWSKDRLSVGTEGLKENLASLSERFKKLRLGFMHEKAALADNDPSHSMELNRLYAFPDEFDTLLTPLQQVLEEAFKTSTFHEGLFLRGVYFTSSLQKGEAPVIGACSNLLGGFTMETPDAPAAGDGGSEWAEKANSKAFFIADFFEEKVFREKGCIKLTEKVREKRRRNDLIALASGTLIAIVILLWAAIKGLDLSSDVGVVDGSLTSVQNGIDPDKAAYLYDNEEDFSDPAKAKQVSTNLNKLWKSLADLQENAAWFHEPVVADRIEQGRLTVLQTFCQRVLLPSVNHYLHNLPEPKQWRDTQHAYDVLSMMLCLAGGPAHCDEAGQKQHWPALVRELFRELDSYGYLGGEKLLNLMPLTMEEIKDDNSCGACFADMFRSSGCMTLLLDEELLQESDESAWGPEKQLGDFRLIRELGRGGMGIVYEAEQISLRRRVALMILPAPLGFSNNAVLKFRSEAEAGGRQHHPGIVSVYAVGEHQGVRLSPRNWWGRDVMSRICWARFENRAHFLKVIFARRPGLLHMWLKP